MLFSLARSHPSNWFMYRENLLHSSPRTQNADLMNMSIAPPISNPCARIYECINYQFTVEHIPGSQNMDVGKTCFQIDRSSFLIIRLWLLYLSQAIHCDMAGSMSHLVILSIPTLCYHLLKDLNEDLTWGHPGREKDALVTFLVMLLGCVWPMKFLSSHGIESGLYMLLWPVYQDQRFVLSSIR